MFFHDKYLQFKSKPDRSDPLFAQKLQEVIGVNLAKTTPVPGSFPQNLEHTPVSYQFWDLSKGDGNANAKGSWAEGVTPDGKGEFEFLSHPEPLGPIPTPPPGNPYLYGTNDANQFASAAD